MVPFSMTLSDLERLSEIFNDTKHRAVCLRQLSFLYFFLGESRALTRLAADDVLQ